MSLFTLLGKIKIDGAEESRRALNNVRDAAHGAAEAISSRLGGAVKSAAGHMADGAKNALILGTAITGGIGYAAFEAAADMDSLVRGLASVSKNADDLRGQLSRLREVAKLPGLGFQEAVQGSLALQSAGLSANLAERSLMAFGNALATVGRGRAELDGVTLALTQIASKGKVSAEEINQINERVPQIRQAMNAAFGTSDTEKLGKMGVDSAKFISGIVTQLEKLPSVTGGIRNGIENIRDAVKEAIVPLGQGIADLFGGFGNLNESLIDKFKNLGTKIGEVLSAIGKSGVINDAFSGISKALGMNISNGLQEGIARFAAVAFSLIKNLPEAISGVFTHLQSVFSAIWSNIAAVANWAYSSLQKVFGGGAAPAAATGGGMSQGAGMGDVQFSERNGQNIQKGGIFDGFGKPSSPVMKGIVAYVKTMLGIPTSKADMAAIYGQGIAGLISGDLKLDAFPTMTAIPNMDALKKAFGNPLKEAGAYYNAFSGAFKPYSDIPDGLAFGGNGGGMAGKSGESVFASWDKYLAEIEKNTKTTADLLDSRRVFGGGELAKMGVTAIERYGPDPKTRSPYGQVMEGFSRAMRNNEQRAGQRANSLYARG